MFCLLWCSTQTWPNSSSAHHSNLSLTALQTWREGHPVCENHETIKDNGQSGNKKIKFTGSKNFKPKHTKINNIHLHWPETRLLYIHDCTSKGWSASYHCELCLCSIKTNPAMQSLRSEGIVPTVYKMIKYNKYMYNKCLKQTLLKSREFSSINYNSTFCNLPEKLWRVAPLQGQTLLCLQSWLEKFK